MRSVEWSQDALDDLAELIVYIADRNPEAAQTVADEIRRAGATLGRHDTGRPGRVQGTREKSLTRISYILSYAIDPQPDGRLTILRVIHSAQDWPGTGWPGRPPKSP